MPGQWSARSWPAEVEQDGGGAVLAVVGQDGLAVDGHLGHVDLVAVRRLADGELGEYQPDAGGARVAGERVGAGSVAAGAGGVEQALLPDVVVGIVEGHGEYGGEPGLGQDEVARVLVLADKGDGLPSGDALVGVVGLAETQGHAGGGHGYER